MTSKTVNDRPELASLLIEQRGENFACTVMLCDGEGRRTEVPVAFDKGDDQFLSPVFEKLRARALAEAGFE